MDLNKLEELVKNGTIKSFVTKNVPEAGQETVEGYSDHCNSDCLVITFPDGETLTVTSITTGSRSDAILRIE